MPKVTKSRAPKKKAPSTRTGRSKPAVPRPAAPKTAEAPKIVRVEKPGPHLPVGKLVRDMRKGQPTPEPLMNPRDAPWQDSIAARRRLLLDGEAGNRFKIVSGIEPSVESIALAVYRFSKGPDFTNDEMGYGEVLVDELWYVKNGRFLSVERVSQRTKTGRQYLYEGSIVENPLAPAAAVKATESAAQKSVKDTPEPLPEQALRPRPRAT
ncbi:MAG TPA: hypothetical protein VFZ61_06395 [Polyangiales bacterium]